MQLHSALTLATVKSGKRKAQPAFSATIHPQPFEANADKPATIAAESSHWRGYLNLNQAIRFAGSDDTKKAVELCNKTYKNSKGEAYTGGQILEFMLKKHQECDGKPGLQGIPRADMAYPSKYLSVLHTEMGYESPTALAGILREFSDQGLVTGPNGAYHPNDALAEMKLTPKATSVYEEWSGKKASELTKTLPLGKPGAAVSTEEVPKIPKELEGFVSDFTDKAAKGEFTPLIGRDTELTRIKRAIKKKDIKSIVLVGEPGIGKRAIIEGLAQQIARNEAGLLNGYRIWSLNLNGMLAGTENQGTLEGRIKALLEQQAQNNKILFYMEDGTWTTSTEQASQTSGLIRQLLADDKSRLVISMTTAGYQMLGRGGESLWNTLKIEPSTKEETLKILEGIAPEYEKTHEVTYSPDILKHIIEYSDKYLNAQPFPAKAIDVMDEAGVVAKEAGREQVLKEDITPIISYKAGIPIGNLDTDEREKLMNIEASLAKRVLGQDHAIKQTAKAIRTSRAQMTSKRKGTMGNFVFTGPTGVGKTELAKALAEWMTGDERNLIRIDMSEYMEQHSTSRLVGAPPGYVGYDEGGQLTEAVRKKPYSVVLLDEVEKAHPEVFNILLQVLDDGRLTDGKGRVVNFNNVLLIMTSNAGARDIQNYKRSRQSGAAATPEYEKQTQDNVNKIQKETFEQFFKPEFRNRINDIIAFNELTPELQKDIVELHLNSYLADVKKTTGIEVKMSSTAIDFLKDQLFVSKSAIHDKQSGRKVLDVIKTYIEDPLAEKKINEGLEAGDIIQCDLDIQNMELNFIRHPAIKEQEQPVKPQVSGE